jgi:hypothetical protein
VTNPLLNDFGYSPLVCGKAKKYAAKARKSFITAQKIPAKFNVFRLRTSLLWQKLDVNSSLQVKPPSMRDCPAFGFDLHNRDHVRLVRLLLSFRLELPCIRRILLNLIDDHVKLCSELPCLSAITSNIAGNFHAQARSSCARSLT